MAAMKTSLLVSLIFSLAAVATSQSCDYYQNVTVGQTFYIYSPGYPNAYSPGTTCRWIASCPTGYNCLLDCTDVRMPSSQNCLQDRLLVSKSGDTSLSGADAYCGNGGFTERSMGQRLSIGLLTANNSPGGRFACSVAASPDPNVNPSCQCGYKKTNRIVNGVETGINEFPMMVGLVDAQIYTIKCGAVIISNRHVMTACHCLIGHTINTLGVVVGEHNVEVGDSPATQLIRASQFIRHPQFSQTNYDYDIAIIVLQSTITFSDRVGPVCLPFNFGAQSFAGQKVELLGWGTTFAGGPDSPYLQKVTLDVISQNSCRTAVPSVTTRQMCTYTQTKDACQDDSGGPVLWTNPQNGLLYSIGIISAGNFCAQSRSPGVNSRVTELLNWVITNTPGVNYCVK